MFDPSASPDEQEETGYTEHEGATVDYWYYQALLVVFPKTLTARIELEEQLPSFLAKLEGMIKDSRPTEAVIDNKEKAKEIIMTMLESELHRVDNRHLSKLAAVAHALNLTNMGDKLLSLMKENCVFNSQCRLGREHGRNHVRRRNVE
jgi:hypothetical protein